MTKKLAALGLAATLSLPFLNGCGKEPGLNLDQKIIETEIKTRQVPIQVHIEDSLYNEVEKTLIFDKVKDFYSRMYVDMGFEFIDDGQYNKELINRKINRKENILLAIIKKENLLNEYERIAGISRPNNFSGTAISEQNIALVSNSYVDSIVESRTICHELGHLFGLWHSFNFSNDHIEDFVDKEKIVPNFMSYEISNFKSHD